MFDIDYVFPYVNNSEPVWIETFKKYCIENNKENLLDSINGDRYKDFGLLPTLINCIKTNMSWIRKIHIIVSNVEQLPPEIRNDEKVHVVLHKYIIPNNFLPTFNSTTIEMFLHNIKDLAEHFIYGNDDMFPVDKLEPSDFFNEDGTKIKINFNREKLSIIPAQFRQVCYNNTKTVIDCFGLPNTLNKREYYRPCHSISPMIKSYCIEVFNKCKDKIYEQIRAFRTGLQHNQYIFLVYLYLLNLTEESPISFKYVCCKNTVQDIVDNIKNKNNQIICINDTPNKNRDDILNSSYTIIEAFKERLSNA